MAFLSSGPAPRPAATIIGVPFDATSTFRTGSRDGPAAIRWASQSIETYSPVLQRDFTNVTIPNSADFNSTGRPPERLLTAVQDGWAPPAASLPPFLAAETTLPLAPALTRQGAH